MAKRLALPGTGVGAPARGRVGGRDAGSREGGAGGARRARCRGRGRGELVTPCSRESRRTCCPPSTSGCWGGGLGGFAPRSSRPPVSQQKPQSPGRRAALVSGGCGRRGCRRGLGRRGRSWESAPGRDGLRLGLVRRAECWEPGLLDPGVRRRGWGRDCGAPGVRGESGRTRGAARGTREV